MDTIIIWNELIAYATRGTVDTLQNMLFEHMCAIACACAGVCIKQSQSWHGYDSSVYATKTIKMWNVCNVLVFTQK